MGAFHSKGGQSFLCTPSTRKNKDGTVESLIRPRLDAGAIVSVPRSATEYGVVKLSGLTLRERAQAMISIAHPDFREELVQEAQQMGLWKNSSKVLP